MSEKQTMEDYEQMKINLASAFQSGDQVGCAAVMLPTAKTLLDLPMELQEHILVESIVADIKERKLFRSGWKESAIRLSERLRNVCPQWDNALTTEVFRNRLHGVLESLPQVKFGFKVLARQRLSKCVTVTSLDNECFVLCKKPGLHTCINIYDHSDLRTIKRKIPLADVTIPWNLVACSTTNCLYILHQTSSSIEIWRVLISEHEFHVSPWIMCCNKLVSIMSISADGSLILFQGPIPSTIKVFDVYGSLQHELDLGNRISCICDIIPKSNGTFVLVEKKSLTEVDRDGNTLYKFNERSGEYIYCAVDLYDWIVMLDDGGNIKLFDSEFNSVNVAHSLDAFVFGRKHSYRVHYNRKRNVFVAFESAAFGDVDDKQCLTIFNFIERGISK